MSADVPRCPQRRSEGSRQSSPGSGESPATARFAAGHGQLRAFCPARCAWSVFLLLVGNGMLFGSLVVASRPPGSAGTAHRSRRRKMVSGTHSRDGGATVRFRRVREPESRRMRDRRLAIRARHPVVLLARADAEPRAAWWARTPTPTSPRPRLPAFAPTSLEVWRARADLGVAADGTPQREAESPFVDPPAGGTPSNCHTSAAERVVAIRLVRSVHARERSDHTHRHGQRLRGDEPSLVPVMVPSPVAL
jgi:hypothetical protein